jgi:hypothetical protein
MITVMVGNQDGKRLHVTALQFCQYGRGITGVNDGNLLALFIADEPDIVVCERGYGDHLHHTAHLTQFLAFQE